MDESVADCLQEAERIQWEHWARPWREAFQRGRESGTDSSPDATLVAGWRSLIDAGGSELFREALRARQPRREYLTLVGDDAAIAALVEPRSSWPDRGLLGSISPHGSFGLRALIASEFPDEVMGLVYKTVEDAQKRNVRRELRELLCGDIATDGRESEWPQRFRPALAYANDTGAVEIGASPFRRIEYLLTAIEATSDAYERRSLAEELRKLAGSEPAVFETGVPFHLAVREAHRDDLIVTVALENASVKRLLKVLGEDPAFPSHRRADGMWRAIDKGDLATLTSTYLWWIDSTLYSVPTSLSNPTSTWLGDGAIESDLRARIDMAAQTLPVGGISEETEATGALIANLVAVAERALPAVSGLNPPIRLSITSTNSRTHEPIYGADIGILLRVELPERELVVTGHLVQVKQSETREDGATPPSWKITRDQIDLMLEHDPTATYWLLCPSGSRLIVVSAKTLLLRFRLGASSCTVQYEDVRSAGVPLGNAIVDLLLGLWIGSRSAVKAAAGEDSRHRPANILEIRLQEAG